MCVSPVLSVVLGMTALQTAVSPEDGSATFLNELACVQEAVWLQECGSPCDLIHPSMEQGKSAEHSFWCRLLPVSELVCRSLCCTAVFNIGMHLMTLQNPLSCKFWNGDYCSVTRNMLFILLLPCSGSQGGPVSGPVLIF